MKIHQDMRAQRDFLALALAISRRACAAHLFQSAVDDAARNAASCFVVDDDGEIQPTTSLRSIEEFLAFNRLKNLHWFEKANDRQISDPNAMTAREKLETANSLAASRSRTVRP